MSLTRNGAALTTAQQIDACAGLGAAMATPTSIRTNYGLKIRTLTYLDRLPAAQSAAFQAAADGLLEDLNDAGILSTLDALYALVPGDLPSAYINLIDTTKTLSATGSVALDGPGVKGDGSTGYLLGLGAPNALTKYVQDSAHISVLVSKAGNQTAHVGRAGTTDGVLLFAGPTSLAARVNSAASDTWNVNNSLGLTTVVRRDASTVEAYRRGVSLGSKTRASTALSSNALALLRANTSYSTDTVSLVMAGSQITALQAKQLYWAAARFMATLGWSDVPIPVESTLNPIAVYDLPDVAGSTPGKGFGVTDVILDPLDGTFWFANDGRELSTDPTFEASIVHCSKNVSTGRFDLIANYPVSAMSAVTWTNKMSVQGITFDTTPGATHPIMFYVKDTTSTGSAVVKMNRAGATLPMFTDTVSGGGLNGLEYDSTNDRLITSGTAGWNYRDKTTGAQIGDVVRTPSGPDQQHYEAARKRVWVTGGLNGVAGKIWIYDTDTNYGFPVQSKTLNMSQVLAIEGITVDAANHGFVTSDDWLHEGATNPNAKNQVFEFDLTGI